MFAAHLCCPQLEFQLAVQLIRLRQPPSCFAPLGLRLQPQDSRATFRKGEAVAAHQLHPSNHLVHQLHGAQKPHVHGMLWSGVHSSCWLRPCCSRFCWHVPCDSALGSQLSPYLQQLLRRLLAAALRLLVAGVRCCQQRLRLSEAARAALRLASEARHVSAGGLQLVRQLCYTGVQLCGAPAQDRRQYKNVPGRCCSGGSMDARTA